MVWGNDRLKYFVSIENTSYFGWQIELLIQSFKRLRLEDDLVIGIADNPNPVVQKYTRNLLAHKNKFVHPNQPLKGLNKFYALMTATEMNLLPKPFIVLHPDMVLIKPVKEFEEDFLIQPEPFYDSIRDHLSYSLPMGNIIGINKNVSDVIFRNAYVHFKNLSETGHDFKWEIGAWMQAVYEEIVQKERSVKAALLEQPLLHTSLDANFIHYKYGIPGIFAKKQFTYDENMLALDYCDPLEAITMNNSTKSIDLLCRVIEFYRVGVAV